MEIHVDAGGNINNKLGLQRAPGDLVNTLSWWYARDVLYAKGPNDSLIASMPYDSTRPWLRISASTTTVYWETSADGCTWISQASAPISALFPVNSVYVVLDAQTYSPTPGTGFARYSHLNTGRTDLPLCPTICP